MMSEQFNVAPVELSTSFAEANGVETLMARQDPATYRYTVMAKFKDGQYAELECDNFVLGVRQLVREHNEYVWARKPKNASHYHL
jgi:hypothetical protein